VLRRRTLVPAIHGLHSLGPACASPSGAALVGYAGSRSTGDPSLEWLAVGRAVTGRGTVLSLGSHSTGGRAPQAWSVRSGRGVALEVMRCRMSVVRLFVYHRPLVR